MSKSTRIGAEVLAKFAPTGLLRAAINVGNPILAAIDPGTNEPYGVSVDLARDFARRLGATVVISVFATADKSVDAVVNERADIGFFAVDPLRAAHIAFTSPYLLIEGSYLVRHDSPIVTNDEVDRAGVRIVVGTGSAYDLFLTREIKVARIVRTSSSQTVVETFVSQQLEVAAGVRQQLETDLRRFPGNRLLDGRFMVIQQAMGCPKSRGEYAQGVLADFVEDMKASGFVAAALKRHRIEGASMAPVRGRRSSG